MKPGNPPLQSIPVPDQLRERIRYMHYSLSTEQVYVYWVRFFIRWSGRGMRMRHPRDMSTVEVEAFLTYLATDRKVSAFKGIGWIQKDSFTMSQGTGRPMSGDRGTE